jgi:hypothetical protein
VVQLVEGVVQVPLGTRRDVGPWQRTHTTSHAQGHTSPLRMHSTTRGVTGAFSDLAEWIDAPQW